MKAIRVRRILEVELPYLVGKTTNRLSNFSSLLVGKSSISSKFIIFWFITLSILPHHFYNTKLRPQGLQTGASDLSSNFIFFSLKMSAAMLGNLILDYFIYFK